MGITIRKIAKIAGVHHSTVDKVIHDRPGVSDEVRDKIKKIIDEVGYQPNLAGKALASQMDALKFYVILLHVNAEPFIQKGVKSGADQYKAFKFEVRYRSCSYSNVEEQAKYLEEAIKGNANGIILMPIFADKISKLIDKAADKGITVVTVGTDIEKSKRHVFVGQDQLKASKIAGRMMGMILNRKGKVAIITASQLDSGVIHQVKMREQLFTEYVHENYPQIEIIEKIETNEDEKITYEKTKELLENSPELDAIYITCGQVHQAGRAIQNSKSRPAVICFETYPEILELIQMEIITCTIDSELEVQALEAFKIIMNCLLYDKSKLKKFLFTKSTVVLKESL